MSAIITWLPLVGGIGTLTIAIMAFLTLRLVHVRTLQTQLNTYQKSIDDRFEAISVFFWTDKKIERGRDIVSYDQEYDKLRAHLWKMAKWQGESVEHEPAVREDIEAINCFCACITRVNLLGGLRLTPGQEQLSESIFGYWRQEIKRRRALGAYFSRYWVAPIGIEKAPYDSMATDEDSLMLSNNLPIEGPPTTLQQ